MKSRYCKFKNKRILNLKKCRIVTYELEGRIFQGLLKEVNPLKESIRGIWVFFLDCFYCLVLIIIIITSFFASTR